MGRDKALLEFAGEPLWQRQRAVLAGAGAVEIFLSARPGQAWAERAEGFSGVLHDALVDGGPLVGVTAALERATQPWVAVLAIDLPRMTAAWFSALRAECRAGVGVVGRHDGFFEPLAAVYPRELRFLAWEAMARGEFSFQRLLAAAVAQGLMRPHEISAGEAGGFENWNEPGFCGAKT